MQRLIKIYLIVIIELLVFSNFIIAQRNESLDYGLDEKLGNYLPMGTEFYDHEGNLVKLSQIIKKPTILTLIYYKCPSVCNPLLAEVSTLVNKVDFKPGIDYQILSISFDHREKPADAKEKRPNYLSIIQKNIPGGFWNFLTGDSSNINKVTKSAGFLFKILGNQYTHPAVLIFISKEGKITRYIYGDQFLPFDIKMGLIEASEGRIGPTISSKFLKFCYNYNIEDKKYTINLMRIALAIMLFLISLLVIYLIRIQLHRRRRFDNK